jgi:hypothetical protein
MIPEIAIIGHPNEGKSSVLSTLAEDDSVRISSTPGETTECRTFPVRIDEREILRFIDTPGFQNPGRVLSEMKKQVSPGADPLREFRLMAANIPELHDDYELLGPLERGAGIIYVVDGSRPLRNVDRAEMEILRLTGKPRMAILNYKEENNDYLADWKNAFRQNFNSNRIFNAHRATYAERILLLEALKAIDQDWQEPLATVITAFKKDWSARNNVTVDIIRRLLKDCLSLQLSKNFASKQEATNHQEKLFKEYCDTLNRKEKEAHRIIRTLFKHNIFQYELPSHSILHQDLFDERTWQLLGLTRKQVIIAGGLGGAAIGVGLDVAALGHGLGVFTAMGTVAGVVSALFGGKNLSAKAKIMGIPLGGEQIQVGPAKSINLLFILLNRTLLYYQQTINWAHGRRDYDQINQNETTENQSSGFTSSWSGTNIKICHDFFKSLSNEREKNTAQISEKFNHLISATLQKISESE